MLALPENTDMLRGTTFSSHRFAFLTFIAMMGSAPRRHRPRPLFHHSSVWRRVAPIERLEARQLLSAVGLMALDSVFAAPTAHVAPEGHGGSGGSGVTNTVPPPSAYTPTQIQQAYGFNQVKFGTITGDGSGQTIAIVDAYGDSKIASDLSAFDTQYGLPAPSLQIVNQNGGTKLPGNNSGWALETSLDVEWAHAMAPAANLLLVEASTSSLGNLLTAVSYASKHSDVVSMSWGASEFSGETSYDSYFTAPGVTFIAASGDNGAGAIWPAVSPNVLGVGGTSLTVAGSNPTYSYGGETGWSGSGGGVSLYESQPTYQNGFAGNYSSTQRTSPDVSYNADPNTGVAVYDSISYSNQSGWFQVGGTSAAAPQWAALVAVADQGRQIANGGAANPLPNAQASLYSLASNATSYSSGFHDVTSGSNGSGALDTARVGYDLVTGLGTPQAVPLVQALVQAQAVPSITAAESPAKSGTGTSSPTAVSPTTTPTVVIEIVLLELTPTPAQPAFVPFVPNTTPTNPAPAASLVMPADAAVQLATNSMLTDDPLAVPFAPAKRASAPGEKQAPDEAPAPRESSSRAWQFFGDEAFVPTGSSLHEDYLASDSADVLVGDGAAIDAAAEQLALLTDSRASGLTAALGLVAAAVLFEKGSRGAEPSADKRTAPRLPIRR